MGRVGARTAGQPDFHGLSLIPQSCLEEQVEILRGKMALLEDQLAKLTETSALPVKGEVLGDVLKVGAWQDPGTAPAGRGGEGWGGMLPGCPFRLLSQR